MPEETKPAQTPEELAKQNEETARKVAEQGRDLSRPATAEDFRGVSEGLDALAEQITKKNDPEEKERLEKEAADKAAAEAAEKAKADPEAAKVEAERKAAEDRANEYFKDAPKLPPNASPKSTEAFTGIKIRAAQEIAAKEAEIEKLRKEIAERDEKLKNPVPPEVEKEIKDLREWRAKLDIDTDPKFKEFDQSVEQTREFIYDQLRKSPNINADKVIEKIKAHGGPEMIESTKALTERSETTKSKLAELRGKFEYMKEQPIDPKADEAVKKSTEAHNKLVAGINASVEEAIKDDSADMRALTILGMAQLMYLQPLYDGVVAELDETKKKLAEATASLAKFKNVSVNRIRETGAPSDGKLPTQKTEEGKLFTTPATQALDDLARGIMEKRQ